MANKSATDSMNRMNPSYKFGMWLGVRNNSAECFIGNVDVYSELVNPEDWNLAADGTKKPSRT